MSKYRLHELDFDYVYHENVLVADYALDADYDLGADCDHGVGYFLGHDFDCDL